MAPPASQAVSRPASADRPVAAAPPLSSRHSTGGAYHQISCPAASCSTAAPVRHLAILQKASQEDGYSDTEVEQEHEGRWTPLTTASASVAAAYMPVVWTAKENSATGSGVAAASSVAALTQVTLSRGGQQVGCTIASTIGGGSRRFFGQRQHSLGSNSVVAVAAAAAGVTGVVAMVPLPPTQPPQQRGYSRQGSRSGVPEHAAMARVMGDVLAAY